MAAAASPVPELLIALRGVSKDYESGGGVVRAMRDVDLAIEHGEFVAIVGASGSGKSTMMNILGCLDRPTRGTYELGGIDVGKRANDPRALVRNHLIGFIFQGFNLLPRTTALENVELPLTYRGASGRSRRKRAAEALAAVGLGDRMHHTPNQLSGGQQQRVAIARALVTNPPLLLADEPTGNLDTRTSLEVLALLQRLNRERGITIVLVTHEHDIAACASRVVTMKDGRIVSDVRQAEPLSAQAELSKLPLPDVASPGAAGAGADPQQDSAKQRWAKLPWTLHLVTLFGGLLGMLAGAALSQLALRQVAAPFVLGGALLGEALLAAYYARARLGRPLSSVQRVRAALGYTLLLNVPLVAVALRRPPPQLEALATSGRGVAALVAMMVMSLAAQALLRYLLLSLVNPPPKKSR